MDNKTYFKQSEWDFFVLETNLEKFPKISIHNEGGEIKIKGHFQSPNGPDDFEWSSTNLIEL